MAAPGGPTPLLSELGVEPGPEYAGRLRECVVRLGLGFRDQTLAMILEIR